MLCAPPAAADLAADVATLRAGWSAAGKVTPMPPRLYERGDLRPVLLPPELLDPLHESCTSVAVLGAASASFVLRFVPVVGEPRWTAGEAPERSVAGAAQLVRCGRRKQMLRRLFVEVRSPRAVLQVVAVDSEVPATSLRRHLGHRDPGPIEERAPATTLLAAQPRARRAGTLERRLRAAGADLDRQELPTDESGSGQVALRLEPGCHRFEVLGADAAAELADVDLALQWADTGEPFAIDRSEGIDASAETCVGERRAARLTHLGSRPHTSALLVHARWPLPRGLPGAWPAAARGAMARALRARPVPSLGGGPIHESLGVAGVTAVPLEVEPGACYVAAVAPFAGRVVASALSVESDGRATRNQSLDDTGTVIAFCVEDATRALAHVEVRGSAPTWLLGVWQTARLPLGEARD